MHIQGTRWQQKLEYHSHAINIPATIWSISFDNCRIISPLAISKILPKKCCSVFWSYIDSRKYFNRFRYSPQTRPGSRRRHLLRIHYQSVSNHLAYQLGLPHPCAKMHRSHASRETVPPKESTALIRMLAVANAMSETEIILSC